MLVADSCRLLVTSSKRANGQLSFGLEGRPRAAATPAGKAWKACFRVVLWRIVGSEPVGERRWSWSEIMVIGDSDVAATLRERLGVSRK